MYTFVPINTVIIILFTIILIYGIGKVIFKYKRK